MRLVKEFEVQRPRADAVAAVATDEALVGLFPGSRDRDRRDARRAPHRALALPRPRARGRGDLPLHLPPRRRRRLREGVRRPRLARSSTASSPSRPAARAPPSCASRWRGGPRRWCPSSPSRARCRSRSSRWPTPCAAASRALPPGDARRGERRRPPLRRGPRRGTAASCSRPATARRHENFRPQVEPLARAGYRVVLWDYRGHGLSGAPQDSRGATRWRRWSTISAACWTTRRRAAGRWSAASPSAASPRCTSPSPGPSACARCSSSRAGPASRTPRRRGAGRRRSSASRRASKRAASRATWTGARRRRRSGCARSSRRRRPPAARSSRRTPAPWRSSGGASRDPCPA